MADNYYGSIRIGGLIRESILPSFIEVLTDAGFDEYDFAIEGAVEQCKNNPKVLEFSSSEAEDGRFESVEEFCVENGIMFHAVASSYCELKPDIRYFDGTVSQVVTTDDVQDTQIQRRDFYGYLDPISELTKDPSKIPLHVNSSDRFYKHVVTVMLSTGLTDGIEILKAIINEKFPDLCEAPIYPLTII